MKFDGSSGVKIVSALGSVACYVLMCGFWKSLENTYYRICLSTIFTGFAVLYTTLAVAVVCGAEVGRSFNKIFAMYGVGAYLGTASSCFVHAFVENMGDCWCCVTAGAVAALQAIFLTIDMLILLNDQPAERASSQDQSPSKELPNEVSSQLAAHPQQPLPPPQRPTTDGKSMTHITNDQPSQSPPQQPTKPATKTNRP